MLSVSNKLDTDTISAAIDKDLRENYGIVTPQSNSTTVTVGSLAEASNGTANQYVTVRGDNLLVVKNKLGIAWALWELLNGMKGKLDNKDVYFSVANEVPMEWGEAWGYCNRYPNAALEWRGGLKTCYRR